MVKTLAEPPRYTTGWNNMSTIKMYLSHHPTDQITGDLYNIISQRDHPLFLFPVFFMTAQ
jgi:hypothetical protein